MRVFVTGATGLLGPNLIVQLSEAGYEIVALVRSLAQGRRILGDRVGLVEGDLRAVGGFEPSLRGAAALIHAGASFRASFAPAAAAATWATNVDGTRELFAAAARQGVSTIVYVSSAGVLRPAPDQPMDENTPYDEASDSAYFQSKIAAEKVARDFAASHPAIRLVTVLPGSMAGPWDMGPTPLGQFIKTIMDGRLKILLPGTMGLVDARDVAQGIVAALSRGASGDRFVIGGRSYPAAEVIAHVARLAGRPVPTMRPPLPMLLLIARIRGLASRLRGQPPALRSADLRRLQQPLRWDSQKAERELGVRFRPLEATLADTVGWFQSSGYLPGDRAPQLIKEA